MCSEGLYAVLFIAAGALTGCLFGNSSDAPANPGESTQTIPYQVEGNTIITSAYLRSDAYCTGNEMHMETDTMDADTFAFQIMGPILTVSTDMDTLNSGVVIEQVLVFTRQGSGTGLEGLWLDIREELRVISGTPSEGEAAELEEGRKDRAGRRVYNRSWARFADGILTSYRDREFAKQFISNWNNEFGAEQYADSAGYAIDVKALDKHTVELKGRKNGETVRITLNFAGTTYSSDTPGHALHRYFTLPKTCPNDDTPPWYVEFRQANRKAAVREAGFGLEKSAEIHPKSRNPRHFPFRPLKTEYSLLN